MSESATNDVRERTSPEQGKEQEKAWHTYISEDLPRTVAESTGSAIRSARSLQHNSSENLRSLQDLVPQFRSQYIIYEDAFIKKVKDELVFAREHPTLAGGIAITAGLLLMRGPRRFLVRQTLGRLQSEEAQISRASKHVKELTLSVDLMKKESEKLLERAALAEKDMKHGYTELMNAGRQIRSLGKSVNKVESEANDMMDVLRDISGREALKLRAEVASTASFLRDQRITIDKKIMTISELGVRV